MVAMGDRLRRVRRSMLFCALAALLLVAGSGCTAALGCILLGGLNEADHSIEIVSPDEGAAFDGAPFAVTFRLHENNADVGVDAFVDGVVVGNVVVPAGAAEATIMVFPDHVDSGTITVVLEGQSEKNGDIGYSGDEVAVAWTAPWAIGDVTLCAGGFCNPLADGRTTSGRIRLAPTVRRDVARLVRVAVEIDGDEVAAASAAPFEVPVDLDAFPDGPHTITLVAERDDGVRATIAYQVEIANCARVVAQADAYTTFGADATRFTYTEDGLEIRRLDTDEAWSWELGDDPPGTRAYDDAGTLYFALGEYIYAVDVAAATPPALIVDAPYAALLMTLDAAGVPYFATGYPHSSLAYAGVYRVAGGQATDVTTSTLHADAVLPDDDGTLLVAAGPELWRLTLADGAEASRELLLTRAGGHVSQLGKDELGRYYLVDSGLGEIVRYTAFDAAPEVLHSDASWSAFAGPLSISFLEYPEHCFGLFVGGVPGTPPVVVDVGEVRGRP